MKQTVEILIMVTMGALLGAEFGVVAFSHPILERLPEAAYVQARSDSARVLGAVMPFWYAGVMVLQIGAAILWRQPALIAAIATMGVVLVLTLTALVPLNNRIAAWSSGTVARGIAHRWDLLHWVRVGLLMVAFTLSVVCLAR